MLHVSRHIPNRHGVLHDDLKCPNIKIFREIAKNILYINIIIINGRLNLLFSIVLRWTDIISKHDTENKFIHKKEFQCYSTELRLINLYLDSRGGLLHS
jgi:hypothetical protein